MLNLTSAMALIPYLLVAGYAVLIARRGETYEIRPENRRRDLVIASIAAAYTIFMILSGGLKFVLLACLLYGPGTLLYVWARREQGKLLFTPIERIICAAAVVGAVVGGFGLATGYITI